MDAHLRHSHVFRRTSLVTSLLALLLALITPTAGAVALASPTGLSPAAGDTVNAIPTLTWDAITDAAAYEVQVGIDETWVTASLRYRAEVVQNRATLPVDLAPGTYFWRVRAIDQAGDPGNFTNAVSFTRAAPPAPSPTTPVDAHVFTYPSDPPILQWQPMQGVKSYQVQWSTNVNFTSGGSETVTTDTSYTSSYALDSLISPARDYYWRVRAVYPTAATSTSTANSNTNYSVPRRFRVNWDAPSTTPVLATPANSPDPQDAVLAPRFSWSSVPGVARYRIQVSASPDLLNPTIDTNTSRTSYTPLDSLPPGAYYWRVSGVDADGNLGPWSATWQFYRDWLEADGTSARPEIIIADQDPSDGLETDMYRDEVLVQWDPVPGASHYEVQFASNDNETFQSGVASKRQTCKTPNTAVTPVFAGGYAATSSLSACNILKVSTLDLWDEPYAYVRVRAIDDSAAGEVPSVWSDQALAGEAAPGPVKINLLTPPASGTPATEPASQTLPNAGVVSSANPVLEWNRVEDSDADTKYLVSLSKSQGFNPSVLRELAPQVNVLVTANTRLVLQEELLDSLSGESYYWYVLPCQTWATTSSNSGCVADSSAINQVGQFRAFRKVTPSVQNLQSAALGSAGSGFRLWWDDQVATELNLASTNPDVDYRTVGVRHYQVEISTDPGFANASRRVFLGATDSTDLVPQIAWNPAETYYWRVRAMDGAGQYLAWSGSSQVSPSALPAPTSVSTVGDGSMASLTWSAVPGAKAYEVELYRGSDPLFPVGNLVAGYPATTEYTSLTPAAQLTAGTFSWRVRVIDHHDMRGTWAPAPGPYVVGLPDPILSSPTDGASTSNGSLTFDWQPVNGAAEYVLQVSSTPDFAVLYDTITTSAHEAVPAKSGGYVANANYYWRVQSRSTAGVLSTSAVRRVAVTTPPGKPTGVKATASSSAGGTLDVVWTAPASTGGIPVTGYRLWLRPENGSWVEQPPLVGDHGGRSLSGLGTGITYEVKVAAVNTVGTGSHSTSATAKTGVAPAAPTSPRVTTAVGGFKGTWSRVTATPSVTGYDYRYRATGGSWQDGSTAASEIEVTGLAGNRQYDFEVRAVNDVGPGAWASVTPFTTLAVPGAPVGLSATPGTGTASISWGAPDDSGSSAITGYIVKYRKSDGAWTSKTTAASPLTLSGLTSGATYEATVAAKNSAGTGPDSASVTFTPPAAATPSPSPPATTAPPATTTPMTKPGAPAKPSGRAKGTGKKRVMVVKWAAPTSGGAPASYSVERSANKKKWRSMSSTTPTAKWKSKKGSTVYVRVRASNAAGPGPYSAVAKLKG